jgi:hypothetical protein
MAQLKAVRPVKRASSVRPATEQTRIANALEQAAKHAKKQLAAEGLKLPTQSWTGSAIRNSIA